MPSFADLSLEQLSGRLSADGYKPSHALRLLRRYYDGAGCIPWEGLKLPGGLREKLEADYAVFSSHLVERQVAGDGTTKLLLRLQDGRTVESVMMTDYREDRVAACLSTQAGCAMGCDFCATAKGGLERNLSTGEIIEQFLRLRAEAAQVGKALRTVVFMGMGEPMHNFANVLEAVKRIGCDELGALGWRQLTVSTVGIVAGIDALAAQGLRVNLAISLHAPDDATRAKLLPAGKRFGVEEIMAAADRYQAATTQPVIIQYCLLKGINDSPEQARQLAALLQGRRMHVNLLHYNTTGPGLSGFLYEPSPKERMDAFIEELRQNRVIAHFRRPRGRDIDAACGQLRAKADAGQ